ncbi:dTDP-4-dehydrorhamnose reductase [Paramylibacter ulvae]|nr:dTDP-4-dehydrorhamnose reductase [Amylibacter ulvae]
MMRVLVFGKSGQVATELDKFEETTCLDRTAADLASPAACAEVVANCEADVIINAAAYTAVDDAESDEITATMVNATSVRMMAEAAAHRDIPFIHISTDYVFDGSGTDPWTTEDFPAPIGAYGRTKYKGEQGIVDAGGRYGILRTSWVFSPHGNNFVKTMLRLGGERDALSIVDDQIGGPTAAHDIASALMVMAQAYFEGMGPNGVYHFSGELDASWADFAAEIFDQAELDVNITRIPSEKFPTPAPRPLNSRLDCETTRQTFGIYRPNWRDSLKIVLDELNADKG